MRSIFTKILLWAIGTTLVSLVGFALTTRLIWELLPGRITLIAKIQILQLEDARSAYEQGGPAQLARYLERLDDLFEAKHFLIDANGRDQVDGRDRSALLSHASTFPNPPKPVGNEFVLASAPTGGSRLLILIHSKFNPWGLLPYYLWIFLLIAALGYALAIYLGRPLLDLRRAVERFGRGNLTTRTGSTRRDEIGELARAFDLMAERIETLMTAQRRLLQDVSHEFRTPLSRLLLKVRLARTSDDRETALDRIKHEVDRLSNLVDELLQVSAAEEDPQSCDHEEIRLDGLLKCLVDEAMIEATAKGCRFALLENEPATVIGDRELLRRAVENVLRNAARHAPDGTEVAVALRRQGSTAAITVRDLGTGVPEDAITTIFEPFYRVGGARSRSDGGVGLGLSISRRAIALHGGKIVASNASPGLSVTIELPAVAHTAQSGSNLDLRGRDSR
ncbi:HAMP domain-containing sensor histidine kinase [Singulisphaera sp. Ch08]|uniref:histidine kinase n=1 Tax=Singulisphaera sp. Ch08 TaxID=3120278 RepID=A0AAU7CK74_9BACT